jgi:RNA polymerase sigma-70 factor (ECF subfamily)
VDDLTVLARAAADGDDAALAELVRRTQHAVAGLCRVLADAADVDDVVQDAYLRIVVALPAFRFDSPVLPWMLSITRRTCADLVRRHQRRRRVLERWSRQPMAGAAAPAGGDAVFDLLARLDPDRREAFLLTQLIGLSYEEVGEVCGCPVGTVRSRVARARAELAGAVRRSETA